MNSAFVAFSPFHSGAPNWATGVKDHAMLLRVSPFAASLNVSKLTVVVVNASNDAVASVEMSPGSESSTPEIDWLLCEE